MNLAHSTASVEESAPVGSSLVRYFEGGRYWERRPEGAGPGFALAVVMGAIVAARLRYPLTVIARGL